MKAVEYALCFSIIFVSFIYRTFIILYHSFLLFHVIISISQLYFNEILFHAVFLVLTSQIVYKVISLLLLHEQFCSHEIYTLIKEFEVLSHGILSIDLSPYPSIVNEELKSLLQVHFPSSCLFLFCFIFKHNLHYFSLEFQYGFHKSQPGYLVD